MQVLKGLNKAVAGNTESSVEDVAQRFWQRLGVQMLRGNYRAFARRIEGMSNMSPAGDAFAHIDGLDVAV